MCTTTTNSDASPHSTPKRDTRLPSTFPTATPSASSARQAPSDVSYAGDLDDYGMFDGAWRAAVDCGDALPHASEYSISGMLIAFDDKTVWETVCAGLDLLGKE